MNFLRRLAVGLCAVVFFFASVGLAWSHVLSRGLDNDKVKTWLEESNFYGSVTDVVLEGLASMESRESGEIPASDPAFREKINEVFDAEFLKENTEQAVDSIFSWLEGDIAQPEFRIDLTEKRVQLASALGDYAVVRAEDLPVCAETPEDFDALSAECLPPGVVPQQLKSDVENELLNESGFITDPVITADTFTQEGEEINVFERTKTARDAYSRARNAPIVLAVITVLTAVGVVLLSSSRMKGFLRLGVASTFTAVALGLGFLLLVKGPSGLKNALTEDSASANQAAGELFANMFQSFASSNQKLMGLYFAGFTLLAIACYTAYFSLKRQNKDGNKDEPKNPEPPSDDSPKNEAPTASTEEPVAPQASPPAKKPRPPRKIQL